MGNLLPVPDYTTVSQRRSGLNLQWQTAPTMQVRHIVIDSTELKVFGAGEWFVRKHNRNRGRRCTWRKLRLGVDEETKEIVAVDLTASNIHDSSHLPILLDQVMGKVGQVSGDRAYDSGKCYQAILSQWAMPTIPPRRNAKAELSHRSTTVQGCARCGATSHQEKGTLPVAGLVWGYVS